MVASDGEHGGGFVMEMVVMAIATTVVNATVVAAAAGEAPGVRVCPKRILAAGDDVVGRLALQHKHWTGRWVERNALAGTARAVAILLHIIVPTPAILR